MYLLNNCQILIRTLFLLLQLSAANLRWDVWEREKQRKKEAEELAWVLTHPVLRGPNGERVAGPAFEPPVPRPPRNATP